MGQTKVDELNDAVRARLRQENVFAFYVTMHDSLAVCVSGGGGGAVRVCARARLFVCVCVRA